MALIIEQMCVTGCGKVTGHVNGKCRECADRQRIAHEKNWETQTDAQKINDLNRRLKKLEQRGVL